MLNIWALFGAGVVTKMTSLSYPNHCYFRTKTTVLTGRFARFFSLSEDRFYRRRGARGERRKRAQNRLGVLLNSLGECARGNTHDEDLIFNQLHSTVLGDRRFDCARPERARLVDESQVDSAQAAREGVE